MGKRFLIDSNIVSKYLSGNLNNDSNQLIDNLTIEISVITKIELLTWNGYSSNLLKVLHSFLEESVIYNLDDAIIEKCIDLRKKYKLKLPDDIIAATAITKNLSIISNDKDFENIKNLKVIKLT